VGHGQLQGDAASPHVLRSGCRNRSGFDRKTYHGKVTQIGGATGSVLSLFPPEMRRANYVKVVQRIPVRVDFTDLANEDPSHELEAGLSVEPKVK